MTPIPPPLQPRLLTAKQAAAYFSLPLSRFEALGLGRVSFGTTVRYDRAALDRYLDELNGLARAAAGEPDEAEQALGRFLADLPGASRRP